MESSFRAYRNYVLAAAGSGWGRLYLRRNWVAYGTESTGSPFGAEDKYFLALARVEVHVAAIVGLVKLSS